MTRSLVLHSADTCSCHFDRLGQGCGALGKLLLACEVTDRLQQQWVACFPPRKHNKWNHSGLKDISFCMCVHAVWHFVASFYTWPSKYWVVNYEDMWGHPQPPQCACHDKFTALCNLHCVCMLGFISVWHRYCLVSCPVRNHHLAYSMKGGSHRSDNSDLA